MIKDKMKLTAIVVVCLVLFSTQVIAKKRHRDRGHRGHSTGRAENEDDTANRVILPKRSGKQRNHVDQEPGSHRNPCYKVRCKPGSECTLDEQNSPKCVCIQECPGVLTADDAVCGSDNRTYESECALRRTKCLGSMNKITRKKAKSLKINYIGVCKEFSPCKRKELKEYPARMKVWLKNVFLDLYDTSSENGGLTEKQRHYGRKVYSERERLQEYEEGVSHDLLEREFQKFYSVYKYPIHWKFGDLDRRPRDGKLSKRELEPLRAPLIPMEHCTKAFFKMADKNGDRKISLMEWGTALGLEEGDINPSLL